MRGYHEEISLNSFVVVAYSTITDCVDTWKFRQSSSLFLTLHTVICYIFVVKIFSYTENVRKYFTRINFTTKIFPTLVGSILHTSTSRIAAAHLTLYTWPLTQQEISFSPAISSARGAISSINAHPRLQFGLSENYFTQIFYILLDKKKANYSMHVDIMEEGLLKLISHVLLDTALSIPGATPVVECLLV